jgi:hypothetical protein
LNDDTHDQAHHQGQPMKNIIAETIMLQHERITPSVFVKMAEQAHAEDNETLAIALLEQAYAAFDRAETDNDSMLGSAPN